MIKNLKEKHYNLYVLLKLVALIGVMVVSALVAGRGLLWLMGV